MTVELRVKDAFVGDRSEAAIKIETVLGAKYVALVPRGSEPLDPDDRIPLERTASPYDVVEAFADLSSTVQDIDTAQLASSFEVLAETFSETPDEVRTSLEGLARLSDTIASRDDQLRQLLSATRAGDPGARRPQRRVHPADPGLQHPAHRGPGAPGADRLDPRPARRSWRGSSPGWSPTTARRSPRRSSSCPGSPTSCPATGPPSPQTVDELAPFVRVFTNTLGNGRWFDSFVNDLIPTVVGAAVCTAAGARHRLLTDGGRTDERRPAARRRAGRGPGPARGAGLDDPPAGRPVPGHRLLHRDGRPLPGLGRPRARHPDRHDRPTSSRWATRSGSR